MWLTQDDHAQRVIWSVKNWNRLNFVTATIAETEHDPRVISGRWTEFVKNLKRFHCPQLRSIRVLQKHAGGHGWHIHALFDRYIPHPVMLGIAEQCGLGRMDFKMVSGPEREKTVHYVVRYICRDMRNRWRDKASKNVRMITASGNLRCKVRWWRRLCDLCIDSPSKHLRASLISILHTFGIRLPPFIDMCTLIGGAPPEALAEWRRLNPGYVH